MLKASLEDTIVAIATPVGYGGIGIVRFSGHNAIAIADKFFMSKGEGRLSDFKSFTVHYGWVVRKSRSKVKKRGNKPEVIDEVLLTVMRAPRSYTREDVVEISCHGGIVSLKAILNLALEAGARLAEPGEFTKRAFLNGRIDLAQAEAVLDIIQSKTDAFLKVSVHQLKGDLTRELETIREKLSDIYTEMEAIVNFPEDDVDSLGERLFMTKINMLVKKVERLLASSEHGKILKEGIKIVICGKPNVGKSSLLNVLLKQPRAIISPIPGTTRDTIEETVQLKGIPFQLVDTAGILEPRDLIEEEAIQRSRMNVERADLVLLVLDGSQKLTFQDWDLFKKVKDKNTFVVINKNDLPTKISQGDIKKMSRGKKVFRLSALKKVGFENLERGIVDNIWHGRAVNCHQVLVSNARHLVSLESCKSFLKKSIQSLKENLPLEFCSEDIKQAIHNLDQITGKNVDSDLLDKIFSQFCIGK